MAGTFATWQPEYAARGIATFPYTASNVDRRQPLVGNYTRMGLPASREMVLKFPDADGLALMAGAKNKITVIDIDARGAEGERLLADAMRRYGQARIVVRTGRDGRHAYYRNAGEPRKIRPDPATPIDLLGGGPVVLPPSKGSQFAYEIIHGTLDDLASLTPIRWDSEIPPLAANDLETTDTVPRRRDVDLGSVQEGRRNAVFYPGVARIAQRVFQNGGTKDEVMTEALARNTEFPAPQPFHDVKKVVDEWWSLTLAGKNQFGPGGRKSGNWMQALSDDPPLIALIGWLKEENRPNSEGFLVADGLVKYLNRGQSYGWWSEEKLSKARRRAMDGGWIVKIRKEVKGVAALFQWGPTAKLELFPLSSY
jgi:hypothetical protein